jgi:hypothetical protein
MISSWVSHHDCGESAGEKGRVDVIISYCHVITTPFAAHTMFIGGRGCRSSTRGYAWAWLHKRLKASRRGGEGAGAPAETRRARGGRGEGRGGGGRRRGKPRRRRREQPAPLCRSTSLPQGAAGPPRHAQRPARSRADAEVRGGGEGGVGGLLHLMSSACIDVRPARLVESAATPSGPMPFELRERGRKGAEGAHIYTHCLCHGGRRGAWCGGWTRGRSRDA